MTEHNMTREEAEAAARAGAKVRHESWGANAWITDCGGKMIDENGSVQSWARLVIFETGWSIVSPAPTPADVGPSDAGKTGMLYRNKDTGEFKLVPHPHFMLPGKWVEISADSDWQANTGTPPDGLVDVVANSGHVDVGYSADMCSWAIGPERYRIAFWRPSDTAKAETDLRKVADLTGLSLEQRMADLEAWREEMTGHFHMTDPREDRTTTPAFTTTRAKPQPATETNPHEEGSRKWAKWHMKRGRKVRLDWPDGVWIEWAGKRQVRWNGGNVSAWTAHIIKTGWQLVGDDQ